MKKIYLTAFIALSVVVLIFGITLGFVSAKEQHPEIVLNAVKSIQSNQDFVKENKSIVEEYNRRVTNNAVQIGILQASCYAFDWKDETAVKLKECSEGFKNVQARDVKASPDLSDKGLWIWNGEPEYKNERLKEYQRKLIEKGITDKLKLKLLVAQLIRENGALSESVIGDNGCSIGIPQYNACAHHKMKANSLIKNKPEWGTYQHQIEWMANRMSDLENKYPLIRCAIIHHNRPATVRSHCSNTVDTAAGYFAAIKRIADTKLSQL